MYCISNFKDHFGGVFRGIFANMLKYLPHLLL